MLLSVCSSRGMAVGTVNYYEIYTEIFVRQLGNEGYLIFEP